MSFRLTFTEFAIEDIAILRQEGAAGLRHSAERVLLQLARDPYSPEPPFKTLEDEFEGLFIRRVGASYRLIYQILPEHKTVKIVRIVRIDTA